MRISTIIRRFIIFSYPYLIMLFVIYQLRHTWFSGSFSWLYTKVIWIPVVLEVYALIKPLYRKERLKPFFIRGIFAFLRIVIAYLALRFVAYVLSLPWGPQVSYILSLSYVILTGASKTLTIFLWCLPLALSFSLYLLVKGARFIIFGVVAFATMMIELHVFYYPFFPSKERPNIEAELIFTREEIFERRGAPSYEKVQIPRSFYIEENKIYVAFSSTISFGKPRQYEHLFVYDLATRRTKAISTAPIGAGMGARHVFSSPSLKYLYFTIWERPDPAIGRVDKKTLKSELIIKAFKLKKKGSEMFPNFVKVYVTPDERFLLTVSDPWGAVARIDLKTKDAEFLDIEKLGLGYRGSDTLDIIGSPDGESVYAPVLFSDVRIIEVQVAPFEVKDFVMELEKRDRNLDLGTETLIPNWSDGEIYSARVIGPYLDVYKINPLRLAERFRLKTFIYKLGYIGDGKLVGFSCGGLYLIDLKAKEQKLLSKGFSARSEDMQVYGDSLYLLTYKGLWRIPLSSIYNAKGIWRAPIKLIYDVEKD